MVKANDSEDYEKYGNLLKLYNTKNFQTNAFHGSLPHTVEQEVSFLFFNGPTFW